MAPQNIQGSIEEDKMGEIYEVREIVKDRKIYTDVVGIYQTMKKFDYSTVIWQNVISFIILHFFALKGLYIMFTFQCQWLTIPWGFMFGIITTIGTTMGAHRLWTHRSYKATLPLRIILAAFQTIAWQRDIFDWVRDHRVHHKYSETDADPHNAKRGLFFSHMGWLMCRKHPEVVLQGKKVDFSDIFADPVVVFQRKHYVPLALFLTVFIPCFVPWYYWNETVSNAFYVAVMLRYIVSLHGTWSVNSFAHWMGNRPFDGYIYPAQNKVVSFLTGGEGWHNYHHVFPYDYRAAELGGILQLNYVATLIYLCEKVGLAYDLRVPSDNTIKQRAKNSGDGTFEGLNVSN